VTTNNAINSPLPTSLADGGTAAALTASNGGIFYSTSSAGAILAGTATANQILLSGSSTSPAWSTATYPATTNVSELLFSSSSNVIGGLTTANNGVLITSGSGVPSIGSALPAAVQGNITTLGTLTTLLVGNLELTANTFSSTNTNGNIIIAPNGSGAVQLNNSTAVTPLQFYETGGPNYVAFQAASTIASNVTWTLPNTDSTGTQFLVSNGSGTLSWASVLSSAWVNQTSTSVTMVANTNYLANASTLITFTLPATVAQGVQFAIAGVGIGGWKIAQAASQQINFGDVATTSGTGGSLASSNQFDVVYLVCTIANTQFSVTNTLGNITYV
jgi:hypothetical protein